MFTQLLESCVHPSAHQQNNKHSWNKRSLTLTGDSVSVEVATFTLALETTRNVGAFLVASAKKVGIRTLVDVCAVT